MHHAPVIPARFFGVKAWKIYAKLCNLWKSSSGAAAAVRPGDTVRRKRSSQDAIDNRPVAGAEIPVRKKTTRSWFGACVRVCVSGFYANATVTQISAIAEGQAFTRDSLQMSPGVSFSLTPQSFSHYLSRYFFFFCGYYSDRCLLIRHGLCSFFLARGIETGGVDWSMNDAIYWKVLMGNFNFASFGIAKEKFQQMDQVIVLESSFYWFGPRT